MSSRASIRVKLGWLRTAPWPLKRPAEYPVMLSPFSRCGGIRVNSAKHLCSSSQAAEPQKQLRRSFVRQLTDSLETRRITRVD